MSYYDEFFGEHKPKKKKSKGKSGYVIVNGKAYPKGGGKAPKKKHSSQPHDDFGGYGGGSLLQMGNFGGSRKEPQNDFGAYVQTGKNLYAMGKNVYHSPLVQFTKKKIGKKLEEKAVEREGMNIKQFGMIRPSYPGGKQNLRFGIQKKVKSNKHSMKMSEIFGSP